MLGHFDDASCDGQFVLSWLMNARNERAKAREAYAELSCDHCLNDHLKKRVGDEDGTMAGNVTSCSDEGSHSCPVHEDARGGATIPEGERTESNRLRQGDLAPSAARARSVIFPKGPGLRIVERRRGAQEAINPPGLPKQDLVPLLLLGVPSSRAGNANQQDYFPTTRVLELAAHCRQSSSGDGRRSEREGSYLEIPESWQAEARPLSIETITRKPRRDLNPHRYQHFH